MSVLEQASLVAIPSGYKASKLYSVVPSTGAGDLTFSRSTTATRVNESGLIETVAINTPRLDFTGGGCGKYLFEPQRTNTIPYSNDFSKYTESAITQQAGFLSPDGGNNATKISGTIGSSFLYYSGVASESGSRSIWARTVSGTGIANLTSHNSNTNNSFTITEEWQRFELTSSNSTGASSFYAVDFRGTTNLSEIILFQAQNEDADYVTSNIFTDGSTVTRTADTSSTSGLSSVINSVEGVFMVGIAALANSGGNRIISLSDGSSNSRLIIYYDSTANKVLVYCRFNGGNQAIMNYTITDATVLHKVAVRYRENDYSLWINGVERDTDTLGLTFTANTLDTFSTADGDTTGSPFFGKISEIVLADYLTDTQMAALTTI